MTDKLLGMLPKLRRAKVLVVGDVMLDEYIWSRVSRISPEAPVPVAEMALVTCAPGGAGNTACNIRAVGGEVYLIGIVGADNNAERLRKALEEKGVRTDFLIADPERPTTLKSRIIAHGQQIVRVDYEEKKPINARMKARIAEVVDSKLKEVDAVLISDYAKGVVTPDISQKIISAAKALGRIVSVDPKGRDYNKYRGATIVTPNRREAEEVSGSIITNGDDAVEAGRRLLHELDLEYVLITRGEDGMSLVGKGNMVMHIPAVATEVYDVTGAGDTAVAALTLGLAAGLEIQNAVKLANLAAGVVVRKVGTAVATIEEIEQAIRYHMKAGSNRKIVSLEELKEIVKDLKSKGKKIIFTNGCFDLLHLGHVMYLQEAKKLGDILIVGVNSDDSVKQIKGDNRPILPEEDRLQIIAALECVDYVTSFSELTPEKVISDLRPDLHVKGGDYHLAELPEAKLVESYGGKVVIVDKVKDRSTTRIINLISEKFQRNRTSEI